MNIDIPSKADIKKAALRIELDKNWKLIELSRFISIINFFYDLGLLTGKIHPNIQGYSRIIQVTNALRKFNQSYFFIPSSLEKPRFGNNSIHKDFYAEITNYYYSTQVKLGNVKEFNLSAMGNLSNIVFEPNLLSIQISSPGNIDVTGFGTALGHLKDLILGLIDRILESDWRKLKQNEKKEEIRRKKIENLNSIFEITDKIGLSETQRQELLMKAIEKQELLVELIEIKKILNVEIIDDDVDSDKIEKIIG